MKNMPLYIKLVLYIVCTLVILSPILVYFYHFWDTNLSYSSSDWAAFGTYLSGFYTLIASMILAVITYYVGVMADNRNETNLKISQQQNRPLLHLNLHNGEERIELTFVNKGKGALIIKEFYLQAQDGKKIGVFADILPEIYLRYDNFAASIDDCVLSPNEHKNLLLFTRETAKMKFWGVESDFPNQYESAKRLLRVSLSKYVIYCSYKDLFDLDMPQFIHRLDWFSRYLVSENKDRT